MAELTLFKGAKMTIAQLLAIGMLLTACLSAGAKCSESRVVRLSEQGETINAIAKKCDMDKADVLAILEKEGEEDPDDEDNLLPAGAVLIPCGCNGFIDLRAQRPEPRCSSGRARPRACPGMCPMGGSPWADVCR
jgi:hypothetical protein